MNWMESCSGNNDHNSIVKAVCRLLPSSLGSCHLRRLIRGDVADSSSVVVSKKIFLRHENDLSSSLSSNFSNPRKVVPSPSAPNNYYHNYYSPATATATAAAAAYKGICRKSSSRFPGDSLKKNKGKGKGKVVVVDTRKRVSNVVSSSSYSTGGGWFSSSDEKPRRHDAAVESDTFFSLTSSNSAAGDSFRLKSSRRFSEEIMKRIDERGNRSFSSVNSSKSRRRSFATSTSGKVAGGNKKKLEATSDHQLSIDQIYYSKNGESGSRRRRRRRRRCRKSLEVESAAGILKESYAVEKRSVDPRSDFRASMVEMIMEKQMVGAGDELERLLLCFLSLNSPSYHAIIIDVFTEICETLFTN
ncbi:transcription repressor OFP2-like [Andrographis paniculata]|uniref:transcription repressor OFP2-like n=1 Tax=Andrographis paniculata TaxID=175694 RepID=UPI0021E908E9|nr:transcription repressor OFP2-like [Andrographis paniculata]